MNIGMMALCLIAICALMVALIVAVDQRDSARRNNRPSPTGSQVPR